MSDNCTALASLNLKEVIKRINTGSEDFWGTASNLWLVLFYVHYIAFIILLISIVFWSVLNLWESFNSWRRNALHYLYLVLVYCTLWSIASALQYILLAVDVSLTPSQDLAVVTYCLEMVAFATSMNGLLIYAVYQYHQSRTITHHLPSSSFIKYLLFTGPSLIIAVSIVAIILTLKGSLAIIAIIVLILILTFIGIMGTTSLVAMYAKLCCRTKKGTQSQKSNIMKMIIRLTSYVYLIMVCCHLLTPFIRLATNSDCIKEVQGDRTIWLSVQTAVKLVEAFLVIQCLTVPKKVKMLFRKCLSPKSTQQQIQSTAIDFYPKGRTLHHLHKDPETACVTKGLSDDDMEKFYNLQEERVDQELSTEDKLDEVLEVTLHHCDPASTRSPCRPIEYNINFNTAVERDILSQTSNSNVGDMFKVQSYLSDEVAPSGKLEHVFQGDQLFNSICDELKFWFNHDVCTPPLLDILPGNYNYIYVASWLYILLLLL